MKRTLFLLAIMGVQALATLLMARVARMTNSFGGMSVTVVAVFTYGIPALLAFTGSLWFVAKPLSRVRVHKVATALLLTLCGHVLSLGILQSSDAWFTWRYIYRMRVQLHADSRFKDVRLICYSDDYILFPYIPVSGNVATEEDRRALIRIFRASHAPAYISAVSVRVDNTPPSMEEFARRTHEDQSKDSVP